MSVTELRIALIAFFAAIIEEQDPRLGEGDSERVAEERAVSPLPRTDGVGEADSPTCGGRLSDVVLPPVRASLAAVPRD